MQDIPTRRCGQRGGNTEGGVKGLRTNPIPGAATPGRAGTSYGAQGWRASRAEGGPGCRTTRALHHRPRWAKGRAGGDRAGAIEQRAAQQHGVRHACAMRRASRVQACGQGPGGPQHRPAKRPGNAMRRPGSRKTGSSHAERLSAGGPATRPCGVSGAHSSVRGTPGETSRLQLVGARLANPRARREPAFPGGAWARLTAPSGPDETSIPR